MVTQIIQGEEVKILTSGGEIDPNIYTVEYVGRGHVGLTCNDTGILIKVNSQRIYKILKEKEMSEIANETETQVEETTETETQTQTTNTPQLIDFDEMVRNGYEVWTKDNLSLGTDPKVASIRVAAHCVIDPETIPHRGYEVFNSYNGTRGKKGTAGNRYLFSEKTTVERKRKTLANKGYIKHEIDE